MTNETKKTGSTKGLLTAFYLMGTAIGLVPMTAQANCKYSNTFSNTFIVRDKKSLCAPMPNRGSNIHVVGSCVPRGPAPAGGGHTFIVGGPGPDPMGPTPGGGGRKSHSVTKTITRQAKGALVHGTGDFLRGSAHDIAQAGRRFVGGTGHMLAAKGLETVEGWLWPSDEEECTTETVTIEETGAGHTFIVNTSNSRD